MSRKKLLPFGTSKGLLAGTRRHYLCCPVATTRAAAKIGTAQFEALHGLVWADGAPAS